MRILEIATTVCIGLLIGVEFAMAVFVNPILWKLDNAAQAEAIKLFARKLGAAMPPWYIASMLLLLIVTFAHRHQPGIGLLSVATGSWAIAIALSVLFLVPINNRLAKLDTGTFTKAARAEHRKWDTLHRIRVATLVVAMVLFLMGIYSRLG